MLMSMPRLTAKDYLRTHDRLRKLWIRDETLLSVLSPLDQWLLHDFFVPSRELGDLALLAHREAVTAQRPSVPHQAGRALSRFWEAAAQLGMQRVAKAKAPAGAARVRQADRKLSVRAVARPEVDGQKLARAFVLLGEQRAKKRLAQEQIEQQEVQDKSEGQQRDRP